MRWRNPLGLVLALVAASAVVVWGLESPSKTQDVLDGSGRTVVLWTVGALEPAGDRGSLALAPPGGQDVLEGGANGLGPYFVPDGVPMELVYSLEEPSRMGEAPSEKVLARVPLRAGTVQLGDRTVTVTGVPLALTPGDPETLRRKLLSPELARIVADSSWGAPGSSQNARVWSLRVYPTATATFAEVFVTWELSEQARMMTRMVLPGNLGARLVVESTPQGLRVVPALGAVRETPGGASGVSHWSGVGDEGRRQAEAFLRS